MNTQPVGRRQCRVLLVEDNEDLAEVTAEFMCLRGLEVMIASSGERALEIAGEFQPEIVLCDMRLPDMPGLDVLRTLRLGEGGKNLLLALYSAMPERDLRMLRRIAGSEVDLFLSKPLTPDTLDTLLAGFQGVRRRA